MQEERDDRIVPLTTEFCKTNSEIGFLTPLIAKPSYVATYDPDFISLKPYSKYFPVTFSVSEMSPDCGQTKATMRQVRSS